MSKETIMASDCACGMRVQFMEYHWPRCPMNPVNLGKAAKTEPKAARILSSLEERFTKAELETIAVKGAESDKPLRKFKKKGKK